MHLTSIESSLEVVAIPAVRVWPSCAESSKALGTGKNRERYQLTTIVPTIPV